jgi:hypothetical protein
VALCRAADPFVGTSNAPITPGETLSSCVIHEVGASLRVECSVFPTNCGRPPRGFVPRRVSSRRPSAGRLVQMAQLEAASVDAFRALRSDLGRLGAPKSLLRAVDVATKDEVRHAREVSREAERSGARVPETRIGPIAARSLEELAIDNAEEGCVRETSGPRSPRCKPNARATGGAALDAQDCS